VLLKEKDRERVSQALEAMLRWIKNFMPPCSFELIIQISSHPAVLFSHNKPANSTFSHNNPAKRTGWSRQRQRMWLKFKWLSSVNPYMRFCLLVLSSLIL
jgi:hypothetical protein